MGGQVSKTFPDDVPQKLQTLWEKMGIDGESYNKLPFSPVGCPCEWIDPTNNQYEYFNKLFQEITTNKDLSTYLKDVTSCQKDDCNKLALDWSKDNIMTDARNNVQMTKDGHGACPTHFVEEDEAAGVTGAILKGGVADMLGLGFVGDLIKKAQPWYKQQQKQFKDVRGQISQMKETIKSLHEKTIEGSIKGNMENIKGVLGVLDKDMNRTIEMMDNKIAPITRVNHLIVITVVTLLVAILLCA